MPAVVFSSDLVASFAPVVERQADLPGQLSSPKSKSREHDRPTVQIAEIAAIVSKLCVPTPAIRAQTA